MEAHVLIPKKLYEAFFEDDERAEEMKVTTDEKIKFDRVIESLPTRYKKIGLRLLNFIWNKGARWNDKGEIIIENSQPLIGSNIVDLLRDSVHTFKFVPNKARDFYAYCARLHVPQSLVANTSRREWLSPDEEDAPNTSYEPATASWKILK